LGSFEQLVLPRVRPRKLTRGQQRLILRGESTIPGSLLGETAGKVTFHRMRVFGRYVAEHRPLHFADLLQDSADDLRAFDLDAEGNADELTVVTVKQFNRDRLSH
jgi:hypothetical protein